MELKEELLRQKTQQEIQKRIAAAYEFLSEISYKVLLPAGEESKLSLDAADQKIKDYAAEHKLEYVVTPLLSQEQLMESQDYPLGRAAVALGPQQVDVVTALFQSSPTDLYRASRADDFSTQSAFAFWKLEDKALYVPKTLDDEPVVREQAVAAWKKLQAEPKAKARAEELAKLIKESGKPMAETLADVTITGAKESLFMTVRETGEFTWMQKPFAPPTGLNQALPVRPSMISGVPDAGPTFYQTVFEKLQPGETGVVPNDDRTAFYVVKIVSRFPSTDGEWDKLRTEFLTAGMNAPGYGSMANRTLGQYAVNWLDELFRKHDVQILKAE
jgi:hypothetical protein